MTEILSDWVRCLAAAAILTGIALAVTPEGRVKSVVRIVCAGVMILALISPLRSMDMESYAERMSHMRQRGQEIAQGGADTADKLSRTIIEEEISAYILDKAEQLGLHPGYAQAELNWSEEEKVWYPVSAQIGCPKDDRLASVINAELGIPDNALEWEGENEEDSSG